MLIKAIVLHHTGTGTGTIGDGSDIAKSIESLVQIKYGGKYRSSYHILVGPTGKVFQGQALNTVAPHCGIDSWDIYQDPSGVNNQNSIAICAIGNFQSNIMPSIQAEAIAEEIKKARSLYNPKPFLKLHHELANTSCPGMNYPYEKIYKLALQEKITRKMKMVVRVQGSGKFTIEMSDGRKIPITERGDHSVIIDEKIWLPLRAVIAGARPGAIIYWDSVNKIATVEWEE